MLKISVLAVSALLLLSGCQSSALPEATDGPSASASATAEPSESSAAAEPQASFEPEPVEGYDPKVEITLQQAAAIAMNTFLKFDTTGIIERQITENGEITLVQYPEQKDQYTAVWFDQKTGESDVVLDAHEFSSAWAYLILSDPEVRKDAFFSPTVGGFSLEYDDPSFGRYGYNYVTDGALMTGAWWAAAVGGKNEVFAIEYDFQVTDEWKSKVDDTVAEFLVREK